MPRGIDVLSLFPEGEREPVESQLTELGRLLDHRSVAETAAAFGRPLPGLPVLTGHVTHTFGQLS